MDRYDPYTDKFINDATDKNVGTNDTINRQQAIDAVTDELDMIDHVPQWVFDRLEKRLKQLPPAQPKIIHCKDCKEYDPIYTGSAGVCGHWNAKTEEDIYCGYAERKEMRNES